MGWNVIDERIKNGKLIISGWDTSVSYLDWLIYSQLLFWSVNRWIIDPWSCPRDTVYLVGCVWGRSLRPDTPSSPLFSTAHTPPSSTRKPSPLELNLSIPGSSFVLSVDARSMLSILPLKNPLTLSKRCISWSTPSPPICTSLLMGSSTRSSNCLLILLHSIIRVSLCCSSHLLRNKRSSSSSLSLTPHFPNS